jgi:hypothetical protein
MTPDNEPLDETAWEALALSVDPIDPPPGLKQALLGRLAGPGRTLPAGFFAVGPGVAGVRSALARWTPTRLPGIEEKFLAHDDARGFTTRLLRFAPGTRYPNHRHAGTEEIFVLEGSLTINGLLLSAGDYCRSDPGTEEMETFSETGGMAIVISCDRDEIQAPAP